MNLKQTVYDIVSNEPTIKSQEDLERIIQEVISFGKLVEPNIDQLENFLLLQAHLIAYFTRNPSDPRFDECRNLWREIAPKAKTVANKVTFGPGGLN